MPDGILDDLKMLIREEAVPYFSDNELNFYLKKNDNNLMATAYECLILKSENTTLSISGMTTEDTSKYFLRLASNFMQTNSGILRG